MWNIQNCQELEAAVTPWYDDVCLVPCRYECSCTIFKRETPGGASLVTSSSSSSSPSSFIHFNFYHHFNPLYQTGRFVFCAWKKFFTVRSARLEKLPPPSPPHTKWDIFKYIFQILRASLAVARMAVFLRAEDLQRTLHTFQSGLYRQWPIQLR